MRLYYVLLLCISSIVFAMEDSKNCFPIDLQHHYEKMKHIREFTRRDPLGETGILLHYLENILEENIRKRTYLCYNTRLIFDDTFNALRHLCDDNAPDLNKKSVLSHVKNLFTYMKHKERINMDSSARNLHKLDEESRVIKLIKKNTISICQQLSLQLDKESLNTKGDEELFRWIHDNS
jgi:hypothetical protein